MRNLKKPAFFFGIAGAIIFFIGIALQSKNYENANFFVYGGLLMGGIFWIWSIVEVITSHHMKEFQKMFWLIIVIAVPVFGGFVYHLLHQKSNKIVT